MKTLVTFSFLLLIAAQYSFGQADDRIPPKVELREAQIVAANFFNEYHKSQDIAPLIKRYFIKDFATRLKFCGTTGKCGGFGRDYWQVNEELSSLNGTKNQYERLYVRSINGWFLYWRSVAYLALLSRQKVSDYENAGTKELDERLTHQLKNQPKLLEVIPSGDWNQSMLKPKTLPEFEKLLKDHEKFITVLRIVERKLRAEVRQKHPKALLMASPREFRVYKEPNREAFFHYPVYVPMFDVGSDSDLILLKLDMIRECGKLRIVAVYPVMD